MPKTTVWTRAYDNARSGTNPNEKILTAAAVRQRGLVRVRTLQTQGDARGCEAQPLVVPDVLCDDGLTHDLVLAATMGGYVYAFDRADGSVVWSRRYVRPIKGSRKIDGYLINDNWGSLSTGVYDRDDGVLWQCFWHSPTRDPANSKFWLLGIDVRNGDVVVRVDLSGATYAPGGGLKTQKFSAAARKQRCSLLLYGGNPVVGFGTIAETSDTAQGWVILYDVVEKKLVGWTTTVKKSGAGLWMGGQGLSADSAGNMYAMTGNGHFDGATDFGESFIKIRYDGKRIAIVDWWSPFSDAGREGKDPSDPPTTVGSATDPDDGPEPTNVRDYTAMEMDEGYSDMDLGSGGPTVIEEMGVIVGAGKDGIGYVVKLDNMGKTQPRDFLNPATNYAKLASPPIFFTYYAAGKNPAPQNFADLNFLYEGRTHHLHSTPCHYKSSRNGRMVFCHGENEFLRAWTLDPKTRALKYRAIGDVQASAAVTRPPGGMPGGMLTVATDGGRGGIVAVSVPIGDGNTTITQGRLVIYDSEDVADGRLKKLWDSQDWGIAYTYNKFMPPVICDGQVLLANYSGGIDVYELTPAPAQ